MSANYNISSFLYDYWWFTSFMEQKGSISCRNSILKEKLCFQMIMKKTLTHFILLEQNRALLFSSSSNPKSHCKTIRWITKQPLFNCLRDYHVPPYPKYPTFGKQNWNYIHIQKQYSDSGNYQSYQEKNLVCLIIQT